MNGAPCSNITGQFYIYLSHSLLLHFYTPVDKPSTCVHVPLTLDLHYSACIHVPWNLDLHYQKVSQQASFKLC